MMTKWITPLLLLAAVAVGCDDQETARRTRGRRWGRAAADRGSASRSADHGWTGGVVYWAEKAKEDLAGKADVIVQTAAGPDEQISQIETLLASGVDGMVVLAHESGPLTPVARKVADRGVYLVNVDPRVHRAGGRRLSRRRQRRLRPEVRRVRRRAHGRRGQAAGPDRHPPRRSTPSGSTRRWRCSQGTPTSR